MMNKNDNEIFPELILALSTTLGHTFEYLLVQKRCPVIPTIYTFVTSRWAEKYFVDGTVFSQAYSYIGDTFDEELHFSRSDEDISWDAPVAFWMGYTVGDILQYHPEHKRFLTMESLQWMYLGYDTLHTQSCKYVWEEMLDRFGDSLDRI